MKLHLILTFILILSFPYFCQSTNQEEKSIKHKYVGVDACGSCHKTEKQGNQLSIWKNTKHAMAYETLLSEDADSIARSIGFTEKASKLDNCLRCHVIGYNLDSTYLGPKFRIEDGVQCETCHGPGLDFQKISIMKNRKEAEKNGLIIHKDIESYCISCHNAESPTFVAINFMEAWKKIQHSVPKKK